MLLIWVFLDFPRRRGWGRGGCMKNCELEKCTQNRQQWRKKWTKKLIHKYSNEKPHAGPWGEQISVRMRMRMRTRTRRSQIKLWIIYTYNFQWTSLASAVAVLLLCLLCCRMARSRKRLRWRRRRKLADVGFTSAAWLKLIYHHKLERSGAWGGALVGTGSKLREESKSGSGRVLGLGSIPSFSCEMWHEIKEKIHHAPVVGVAISWLRLCHVILLRLKINEVITLHTHTHTLTEIPSCKIGDYKNYPASHISCLLLILFAGHKIAERGPP